MSQASNKKAVALNLKVEGGREALKRLIETADVFVENYRPGAFEKLGLGYEDMEEAAGAGARIVKPAEMTFYGGYAGYFIDPDGHLWEVVWNPANLRSEDLGD